MAPDDLAQDLFLARKDPVERRLADPEFGGDIAGPDLDEAPAEEQPAGRLENAVPECRRRFERGH